MITDENHIPYDRVPLSKNYLTGKMPTEALYFKKQDYYDSQKTVILSGKCVTVLDVKKKTITFEDKSEVRFGKLLLATGGAVRHIYMLGSSLKTSFTCGPLKIVRQSSKRCRLQKMQSYRRRLYWLRTCIIFYQKRDQDYNNRGGKQNLGENF